MKISKLHVLVLVAFFGGLALAANFSKDGVPRWAAAGFWLGPNAVQRSTSLATNLSFGSIAYDFPAMAANTCVDSAPVAVIGAKLKDPCFLGVDWVAINTRDGGTAYLNQGDAGSTEFNCIVNAAGTAVVRACAEIVQDPSDAGFYLWTLSNQAQ